MRVTFENTFIVSIRMEHDLYAMVKDIAALETQFSGRRISAHELIRAAVRFMYEDNDRMRECFRRSRKHQHKSMKTKRQKKELEKKFMAKYCGKKRGATAK